MLIASAASAVSSQVRCQPGADLRRACEEFEGMFLGLLLQQMRATLPRGGLLSGGTAGDIFQSLWTQEVARAGARSSRLGIADLLMQQLTPPARPRSGASQQRLLPG
jgi:flagellar protein FlgJ